MSCAVILTAPASTRQATGILTLDRWTAAYELQKLLLVNGAQPEDKMLHGYDPKNIFINSRNEYPAYEQA